MRTVKYEVDLANLPKLTDDQTAEIEALAAAKKIDFSDIPKLTDGSTFWKNAMRNPFYRPKKEVTTIRLDADILLWLKGEGSGYQTRINSILRDAMLHKLHKVR